MIFSVGARRSGTNWLQRIVGAHPNVAVVPSETYLFSRGIKPLRERFHHGVFASPTTGVVHMDRDRLLDALRDFCDGVFLPFLEATPGAERLAERTPEHATCLDLIGEVYPDAHVVHIVRDGRDVVRSLLAQGWRTAPRSIEKAAEEWASCVDAAEQAGATLRRYLRLRYEDMLADPRRTVTELYEGLDLETTPSIVDAALLEAGVPVNVDPTAPSLQAGKWRETFTSEDLAAFERVAGDSLARLGYNAETTSSPTQERARRRSPEGSSRGSPDASRRTPRSIRSLFRRASPERPGGGGSKPRDINALLIESERILGRLVASFTTARTAELDSLLAPAAWVRVVSADDDWSGRGQAARERLAEVVAADDILRGRQAAGDVHVGIPTSSALMRFIEPNGSAQVRVVAVTIQNGEVERITYYRIDSGIG